MNTNTTTQFRDSRGLWQRVKEKIPDPPNVYELLFLIMLNLIVFDIIYIILVAMDLMEPNTFKWKGTSSFISRYILISLLIGTTIISYLGKELFFFLIRRSISNKLNKGQYRDSNNNIITEYSKLGIISKLKMIGWYLAIIIVLIGGYTGLMHLLTKHSIFNFSETTVSDIIDGKNSDGKNSDDKNSEENKSNSKNNSNTSEETTTDVVEPEPK